MTPRVRVSAVGGVIALCLQVASGPVWGADILDRQVSLDIQNNTSLEDALIEWGEKAGVSVMINTLVVEWKTTRAVHGKLNARRALTMLLEGSELSYTEDGYRIQIIQKSPLVSSSMRYSLRAPNRC